MKAKLHNFLLPSAILACTTGVLHAADQTWNDTDSNNTWNTTNTNWISPTAWVSGSTAIFGGTGELVTLGSAITAGGITFNAGATNYEIAGGGNTLTLAATTGFITANETAKISAAVAIGASPTITVASAKTLTMSGIISGAAGGTYSSPNYTAGLTKSGTGTLVLSGANTYTGLTIVSQGVIRAQSNTAMGTNGTPVSNYVVIKSGAAVELDSGYGTSVKRFHFQGSGIGGTGAIRNIAGDNGITGNNYMTGAARINSDSGTLTIGGQLNPNTSGASVESALTIGGTGNVTISATNAKMTALTKDGTGTLLISGTVTNTGATDVQDGIMQLTGTLGTATTLNLGNGVNSGKFILGSTTAIKDQTVAGLTSTGSGTTNAIVGGNSAVSTLTVNLASGTNTYAGVLGGTGTNENALGISKSGTGGTLILTGSNTYTGPTTVTSGTLVANGAAALGSTSNISIGGSGVLSLRADASTNFAKVSDSTLYSVSASASGATINVDQATIAGSSAKTMTLGTLGSSSVAATYQLNFTGANNTGLTVGAVSGPASTALGTVTLSNSNTTGTLTLASYTSANTTGGESLKFTGAGNTTVSGAITPSSTVLEVQQSGTGIVTLNGTSSYTGTTTVSSGTLRINSIADYGTNSAIGQGTSGAPVVIGSASASGILEYAGAAATSNRVVRIGSTAAGTSGSATINNNGSGTLVFTETGYFNAQNLSTDTGRTLTLGGANADANEIKGIIRDMSAIGATIGVTKADAGTWILSGANTYTGATTVNNGTLVINGNNSAATGAVSVTGTGSRLAGVGTIGGITSVGTGAILSAGDHGATPVGASGALTTSNNLSFASGSIFNWDINTAANTSDSVSVGGTLTVTSGAIFKVISSTAFSDGFWSSSKSWSVFGGKDFSNFTLEFVANGATLNAGDFAAEGVFTIDGATQTLIWTAVPEPTSALAGLLLGAGLLRRRRRA